MLRSIAIVALIAVAGPCLAAQSSDTPLTIEAIEAALYDGGPLPEGPSAITAKVQVLLDRAGISPGVIDGRRGQMSSAAISAFEAREGLSVDGVMDAAVWTALGGADAAVLTGRYTIAASDFDDLVGPMPADPAGIAGRDWHGYVRITEKIAEAFHMDEDFLLALNPGLRFGSGVAVAVVAPGARAAGEASRVEVDAAAQRVTVHDGAGRAVASYPAAVGSGDVALPDAETEIAEVQPNPAYTHEAVAHPPGPNGPVGGMWIGLAGGDCGIHGTSEPARILSHDGPGCVRLTNWDAAELAALIDDGVPVAFRD